MSIWRPPTQLMSKEVTDFIRRSTTIINHTQENANLTRDKDLQEDGFRHLTALAHEVIEHKQRSINKGNENMANILLCIECIIDANRSELRMWIQLKERLYDDAWNSLISTQNRVKASRRAHEISKKYNIDSYLSKLNSIEQIVFPEQQFNSPALIVLEEWCTICDEKYSKCSHIAGKPYWGEFCSRRMGKIIATDHLAIVDEPESKQARVYVVGKEGEGSVDIMTGLPVSEIPEERGAYRIENTDRD